MWIKQVHQKNVSFVTIVTKILDINLKNMSWFINDGLLFKKLSAKGTTFRCLLMGISKNEGLKRLNNLVTYNKGVL